MFKRRTIDNLKTEETTVIAIAEHAYFEGNVKMGVKDRAPSVLNLAENRGPQSDSEGVLPQ